MDGITMKCSTCGERTKWGIAHVVEGTHIRHAFECRECGMTVPVNCLKDYIRTGLVIRK